MKKARPYRFTGIFQKCWLCNKEYYVQKARIGQSVYCSIKCHLTIKNKTAPKTAFKPKDSRVLGDKNIMWRGNDAGYSAIHKWLYRQLGKANYCSNCNTTDAKKYEWANISKEYRRNVADWISLCTSCHQRYDESRKTMWQTRRAYV